MTLAFLPSVAGAQSEYEITTTTTSTTTSSTSTSVLPDEVTTSTEAPTTTEAPATTETTEPAEALPDDVTSTTAQVLGDVVSRPLPRTGNDIGGTAIFGGALTVLGIALALGARKRRNSFDAA